MRKSVWLLSRLQLCNLFRFNEVRYTKDSAMKKRAVLLGVAWLMVLVILVGYVVALSVGLAMLGLADIIPVYLYTLMSVIILFLSFFKAGNILFSQKSYEMLIPLPVTKTAIIVSRFVTMYVTNLLAGFLVMLPGMVVYGIYVKPGISFYLVALIGTLFLPLLPLTISSMVGALITAAASRMKHKSLGETLLMVLVIVIALGGSMLWGEQAEQMDRENFQNLAVILRGAIGSIYPPAIWFANALNGDMAALGWLVMVSVLCFVLFALVVGRFFSQICAALNATVARNNYRMEKLQTSSLLKTLWKKEWKRYFSSSAYVTNTIVGYVLAVVLAATMLVVGVEKMVAEIGIAGGEEVVYSVLPFLIAVMFGISTTSACAISIEGKNRWILQTLPVPNKAIMDSKLLLNLSIAAPFYVIIEVLLWIALQPDWVNGLLLLLIPAVYICFLAVVGLAVNLAFPVYQWENEVQVVKQSMAVLFTMLIGMAGGIIPAVCVGVFHTFAEWISLGAVVVLVFVSLLLYKRISRSSL